MRHVSHTSQPVRPTPPLAVLLLTTTCWMFAACDSQSPAPIDDLSNDAQRETSSPELGPSHVVRLTDYNFDRRVLGSAQPVLVDFRAPWCTSCLEMAPVFEELAADFEGRALIGKVDVDRELEIARRFHVRELPVIHIFQNGELIDRLEGTWSRAELSQRLTRLLGPDSVSDSQRHVQ